MPLSLAFIGLVLSLATSSALAATSAASTYFPDVPTDHDNAKALRVLQQTGLLGGYPDGTFRPGQTINRAELLKILIGSIGTATVSPPTPGDCFPDVRAADWFSPYVCLAVSNGWVEGYPDGMFRPERQVTLVEALKMLATVRQYDTTGPRFPAEGYPRDQWFTPYIDTALSKDAVSLETITGRPIQDGLDKPLTRMRAAEILYRAMLSDGRVRFSYKTNACALTDVKTVSLRKYEIKYNDDNTVIVDFDILGTTGDGKECIIAINGNPYAGVSRWWYSRTMFLVEAHDYDQFVEEVPVINGNIYLRGGHETAGLGKDVWRLDMKTGSFELVTFVK